MPTPVLFHHPASLEHDTGPGHPERVDRLEAIELVLGEREGWLGWEARESPRATDAQLQAVHPGAYVAEIDAISAAGGGRIDADTVMSAGSAEAARRAAGGAVAMVDVLLGEGGPRAAASLHRPPGHHAEPDRAMGFCLFNSVAVAAQHALDAHGLGRVLVVDWDVHHGNGTNAAFHATPQVLFCSVHEAPLYPGTGPASDEGSGAGLGYTVNMPVPAGSGDDVWCSLLEHVVAPLGEEAQPGLVLVSAGYDAHADDPLAGCAVTDEGYERMAGTMRRLAGRLGVPLGIVLEGGYALEPLVTGLGRTLRVAGAEEAPAARELEVHPLAERARGRLGRHWPFLR